MAKDFKGDVGFGDKGYGRYASERGYGEVGLGDKGYGNYASAPGYAADLGVTYPDLSAPPGDVGVGTKSSPADLAAAPPGPVGFDGKGYGDYARSPGYADVGLGDKGYGSYARSRGYAKLGMSYPDLRAPAARLGTTKKS